MNMENIEEVFLTPTHGYRYLNSEFYKLNKKIKNAKKNGFRFSEKVKLSIKIESSLSHIIDYVYIGIMLYVLCQSMTSLFCMGGQPR